MIANLPPPLLRVGAPSTQERVMLMPSPVSSAATFAISSELQQGLCAPQASVAPKYFYDALGSKLFEAICELPEYYPTRTEAAIVNANMEDIAASIGADATLIDLGAGNCAKAARLFPALQLRQYVPVDISADFLGAAVEQLQRRFPALDIASVAQDFSGRLRLPPEVRRENRVFFYPGSSIGNFTPDEAVTFLRGLREDSPGCGLLIGVDLAKEKTVLDAAYDDALGVTASFNLNLLLHLNRLLNANFAVRDWRHRAFFQPAQNRVEMHLEARRDLKVVWNGGERSFVEGECIHTESSYKYTTQSFTQLLARAGFNIGRCWTDAHGWFVVCHAHAG
jgi:dimethylhistidine N-methyltransferase